jgi:hypothetical protein
VQEEQAEEYTFVPGDPINVNLNVVEFVKTYDRNLTNHGVRTPLLGLEGSISPRLRARGSIEFTSNCTYKNLLEGVETAYPSKLRKFEISTKNGNYAITLPMKINSWSGNKCKYGYDPEVLRISLEYHKDEKRMKTQLSFLINPTIKQKQKYPEFLEDFGFVCKVKSIDRNGQLHDVLRCNGKESDSYIPHWLPDKAKSVFLTGTHEFETVKLNIRME